MSAVSCKLDKFDESFTLKKIIMVIGGALFTLLAGCGSDKGTDFVGHWTEVNAKSGKPTTMDISYDGEMFTVNRKSNSVGLDFKDRFDGKAESDTALSFMGGMAIMRLQNGRVFYGDDEFIKSP
jgi:hypothetical protein